jgi:hypothetical protein
MVYWLTHEIGEDITDEGYALNLDPRPGLDLILSKEWLSGGEEPTGRG